MDWKLDDGWTKGGKDRWMNEWKKGWIVMDEWVDGMNRRMNVVRWVDEWKDGRIDDG